MTEPDRDGPQERATAHCEGIRSDIFALAHMVSQGEGRWIDEKEIIQIMGQLEGLREYRRLHRVAA